MISADDARQYAHVRHHDTAPGADAVQRAAQDEGRRAKFLTEDFAHGRGDGALKKAAFIFQSDEEHAARRWRSLTQDDDTGYRDLQAGIGTEPADGFDRADLE